MTLMGQDAAPDAGPERVPGIPTASTPPPVEVAEEPLAWWVPAWYVVACAVPFALAFLLPVPLIMMLRSTRPPVSFTTAAWAGIGAGWVLWLVGSVAWLLGGAFFAGERERSPQGVDWWHRTTRMWIVIVLVWGIAATVGIWVFYAVAGSSIGLTDG
ncbi:MAG TPA: hypothetical protein VLV82_02580 [Candidatus Angelobacter sp.]|nr:hypothetical protein [Candidatus Angelobacter sp.]